LLQFFVWHSKASFHQIFVACLGAACAARPLVHSSDFPCCFSVRISLAERLRSVLCFPSPFDFQSLQQGDAFGCCWCWVSVSTAGTRFFYRSSLLQVSPFTGRRRRPPLPLICVPGHHSPRRFCQWLFASPFSSLQTEISSTLARFLSPLLHSSVVKSGCWSPLRSRPADQSRPDFPNGWILSVAVSSFAAFCASWSAGRIRLAVLFSACISSGLLCPVEQALSSVTLFVQFFGRWQARSLLDLAKAAPFSVCDQLRRFGLVLRKLAWRLGFIAAFSSDLCLAL
jgi:hypothetical protein